MRPLSSDLREFIHLLNTNGVKYIIAGAWALAFHGRTRYTGDLDLSRDVAEGQGRPVKGSGVRHSTQLTGRQNYTALTCSILFFGSSNLLP
jgi:hypothetical protein